MIIIQSLPHRRFFHSPNYVTNHLKMSLTPNMQRLASFKATNRGISLRYEINVAAICMYQRIYVANVHAKVHISI